MPVSKRLKDGIKTYLALHADYELKTLATDEAKQAEEKARRAVYDKANELLLEMKACAPAKADDPPTTEMLIEIDGKILWLCQHPKDSHNAVPSYVREVKIER